MPHHGLTINARNVWHCAPYRKRLYTLEKLSTPLLRLPTLTLCLALKNRATTTHQGNFNDIFYISHARGTFCYFSQMYTPMLSTLKSKYRTFSFFTPGVIPLCRFSVDLTLPLDPGYHRPVCRKHMVHFSLLGFHVIEYHTLCISFCLTSFTFFTYFEVGPLCCMSKSIFIAE